MVHVLEVHVTTQMLHCIHNTINAIVPDTRCRLAVVIRRVN